MSAKYIQQKIEELEMRIVQGKDNVESMRQELSRLKVLEFEESMRDDDEKQLLKG